jgi:hypothetical protein
LHPASEQSPDPICATQDIAAIAGINQVTAGKQGAHRDRDRFYPESAARPDQRRRQQGSGFHVPERFGAEIHRPIASADVQRAAILLSRHHGILRHCGVDLVKKDFLGTPAQPQEN